MLTVLIVLTVLTVETNRACSRCTTTEKGCSDLVIALQTVAELIEVEEGYDDIYDNLTLSAIPSDFAPGASSLASSHLVIRYHALSSAITLCHP